MGREREREPRTSPSAGLAERNVVAALLKRDTRIALLRRSAYVASDRHKWQCVTGDVAEGTDPDSQAWQEILEETGLDASHLRLLRHIPSVSIRTGDTTWVVHPYLFETV